MVKTYELTFTSWNIGTLVRERIVSSLEALFLENLIVVLVLPC